MTGTVIIPYRFTVRGGTAAALASVNEVPLTRELVYETDTGYYKIGDGVTAYNSLVYAGIYPASMIPIADAGGYFTGATVEAALQELGAAADGGSGNISAEGSSTWDFVNHGVLSSTSSGTSFVTNSSTPVAYTSGSGATATIIADEASAAGICQLATGSTSSGYARMYFSSPRVVPGTDEIQGDFRIRIPTLSNGTQRFGVLAGYANIINGSGLQRIQAFYEDDVNSGQWSLFVTDGGGSATPGSTSVAAVANTWANLRITINAAGTLASLYVDDMDTPATTVATNIPTVALGPSVWMTKTAGSASRTCDVDYGKHTQTFTTPR